MVESSCRTSRLTVWSRKATKHDRPSPARSPASTPEVLRYRAAASYPMPFWGTAGDRDETRPAGERNARKRLVIAGWVAGDPHDRRHIDRPEIPDEDRPIVRPRDQPVRSLHHADAAHAAGRTGVRKAPDPREA